MNITRNIFMITITVILTIILLGLFWAELKQEPPIVDSSNTVILCSTDQEIIDQTLIKVQEITSWNVELPQHLITECINYNVSIFEEALPIIAVESAYKLDAIHTNNDGTRDIGLFQLNELTYSHIINELKTNNIQLESWDKFNPKTNITAGVYWLSYLREMHGLKNHSLYTSYHRGVPGARKYADKTGTYISNYSKQVEEIKKKFCKK